MAKLETTGRIEEPGRAAIELSKRLGLWDTYAPIDALSVPADLRSALGEHPAAERFFDEAAPSYRRNVLRWIAQAKTPATRTKRIATLVQLSVQAQKVPQM